jgi:hypothetical protein
MLKDNVFFQCHLQSERKKYLYVKIECYLLPFIRACNVKKKIVCVKINYYLLPFLRACPVWKSKNISRFGSSFFFG